MQETEVKRTLVMNFRGDLRDIALLVAVYEDIYKHRITSKSSAVRMAVADYASILRKKYNEELPIAKDFNSTHYAEQFLIQRGLLRASDLEDGKQNRVDAISLELVDSPAVDLTELEKKLSDPDVVKRAEELGGGD